VTQTAVSHEQAVAALGTARTSISRRDHASARETLAPIMVDAERWGWLDVASDGHFLLGEMLDRDRNPRAAADEYTRAYDGSRRLGDRKRGLRDLNALSNSFLDAGAHAKASEAAAEAYRLAVSEGDLMAQATAQNNLAEANRLAGRLDAAREGYERALDAARRAGEPAASAAILLNLGVTERRAGRLAEARDRFTAASELAQVLGDERAGAYARWNLEQIEAEVRAREGQR
jgi:tetratricopeptide (TPR) repeat protein